MNINNWIKESHKIALSKGWYDCDECMGRGKISKPKIYPEDGSFVVDFYGNTVFEFIQCKKCNATGKKDRDISEMVALIISELYEMQRAHRKGKFAEIFDINSLHYNGKLNTIIFESYIKDSFEDECADVLIRLFDMMGYLGIDYDKDYGETLSVEYENTLSKNILMLNEMLIGLLKNDGLDDKWIDAYLHVRCIEFIQYFLFFCREQNIDIETHVNLKMEYNKTREYKHGKKY